MQPSRLFLIAKHEAVSVTVYCSLCWLYIFTNQTTNMCAFKFWQITSQKMFKQ